MADPHDSLLQVDVAVPEFGLFLRAQGHEGGDEDYQLPARVPHLGDRRLRTAVRQALAGAADEEECTARLAAKGVLLGVRRAPSGDVPGYKFALTADDETELVWFSGSKLASDLTQPKIRARFTAGIDQPTHPAPDKSIRLAASRHKAGTTVERAYPAFDDEQDTARAEAAIWGDIEVLYAGPATGRGEDATVADTILTSLVLLAIVITKWHAAQGHRYQAEAARAHLILEGRLLQKPDHDRQADAVRRALPADQASRLLAEDNWAALAVTLAAAG
ncbi:hypothetical protein ACFVGM_02065 [Kitasatospora purpeofusca]|uniref:hypothetical protein n=1 Tax=Kitasatospora purpeofusca TaxID=67352 RepID=UPI003676267D